MPEYHVDLKFDADTSKIDEISEKIHELIESAEELGAEATESIEEVTNNLSDVSSESEEATEAIEDIAKATEDANESTEKLKESANETKEGFEETTESAFNLADAITAVGSVVAFDQLLGTADNITTSWQRLGLVFKGTGTNIDTLKEKQSELTAATGRSGGTIREYFNAMGVAGITNANLLSDSFEAVSGRAFITGKSVESLEATLQRLTLSGNADSRSLVRLGLGLDDLGAVMGTTGKEASKMFKTLSQEDRLRVLVSAMGATTEANEDYKHSLAGMKEQAEASFVGLVGAIGETILPFVIPALQGLTMLIQGVTDMFKNLPGPVRDVIGVLGGLAFGFAFVASSIGLLVKIGPIKAMWTALMEGESVLSILRAGWAEMAIAEWSALGPILLIVGAVVAVGLAIYELGKYLGWWSDFGSMIESVRAGLQRLWSAFVNNPDVQGFIQAITSAWNSLTAALGPVINQVLRFFNVQTGGEFDVVRMLIMGVQTAWTVMTFPIRTLITVVNSFFNAVKSGVGVAQANIGALQSGWSSFVGFVQSCTDSIYNAIVSPFQNAYNVVKPILDLLGAGVDVVSGWFSGFNDFGSFTNGTVDYSGFGETLNNTLTNTNQTNNGNGKTELIYNNYFNGIIERAASEYIVNSLAEYMKTENTRRGV